MAGELKKHIVVCPTKEDVEPAKALAKKQGGEIGDTFSISFHGFEVMLPSDTISTFESSPHIESIELDKEVRTQ